MFEPDDELDPLYEDNDDVDWLNNYIEQQQNALPSQDNKTNIDNNVMNDVINLDDDDDDEPQPQCNNNKSNNINTYIRSQRVVALKQHRNNNVNVNDNDNDSDCVEIEKSELTRHLEAKHENKCKIKMLTMDETKQLANERVKHKNDLAMIKEAKRKKYKTIPSNMRFNSFTGEFEQIKTSFDEAIEKEFQDSKYFIPQPQYNNTKYTTTPETTQHKRNHNYNHKVHFNNKEETNSTSDKSSHCSQMKFINKKHNKPTTHSDYSFSDNEFKNTTNRNYKHCLPKDNSYIIDMTQMKYDIVKQIYMKDKHCRKDLMIIFKQIKHYIHNKTNFKHHYNYLIQEQTHEQLHQIYSIGTFLYKTLCQHLILTALKHPTISLTNNSLWRASDIPLIIELIQKDELSKH